MPQPSQETEAGHSSNQHHPEPQEHVYLLDIQIYGQGALGCVSVGIGQVSDFEIAHSYSRKGNIWRSLPVIHISIQMPFKHFNAVKGVVSR